MSDKAIVRRVVACIDGTWYDENGQCGKGNASNIYRLSTAVKQSNVKDSKGKKVKQIVRYFRGIGIPSTSRKRADIDYNVDAKGCKEQIQEVYEFCHEHIKTCDDEVWLFGFSRGAYVSRAVAGLLHDYTRYASLPVPPDKPVLSSLWRKRPNVLINRRESRMERRDTFETPTSTQVRFLGLFDTVRPESDDTNITHVSSIKHVRHALALNEKRDSFTPVLYDVPLDQSVSDNTSCLQAWFVGAHVDIGGGELHDGLSMYPLQWMLIESQKEGLVLVDEPSEKIPRLTQDLSPLSLVFPRPIPTPTLTSDGTLGVETCDKPKAWTFRFCNGLETTMYDMRSTHNQEERAKTVRRKLQSTRGPPAAKHVVRLNDRGGGTVQRQVFAAIDRFGILHGYNSTSQDGTIIHPSVYFLMDAYANESLRKALRNWQQHLERFRSEFNYTADSLDPWTRHEFTATVGCCRILVCGNAGVGKSTLLNRVFGIPMTQENSSRRGRHNIDEAFESDSHPGIILHDSEGFQSGEYKEVRAFKEFLKKRCAANDAAEQLHAIWLCIETDTNRPVQKALADVLERTADVAPHIPIFIVGTKKDKHCAAKTEPELTLLSKQEKMFRHEFETDAYTSPFWSKLKVNYVFVAYNDKKSIQTLIQSTMDYLDQAAGQGLLAAQVQDVELKIDQAITQTIDLLRSTMITATVSLGTGVVSMATAPTLSRILCHKIAYACFGIPKKQIEGISSILNDIVWANLAPFITRELAQAGMWGGTALLTVASIGLAAKVMKDVALLDAPAAARMLLKCACDLILILDQAFRDGGKNLTLDKIRQVSLMYSKSIIKHGQDAGKTRRRAVHGKIKEAFAMSGQGHTASYRNVTKYRQQVEQIIKAHRFQDAKAEKKIDQPVKVRREVRDRERVSVASKKEKEPANREKRVASSRIASDKSSQVSPQRKKATEKKKSAEKVKRPSRQKQEPARGGRGAARGAARTRGSRGNRSQGNNAVQVAEDTSESEDEDFTAEISVDAAEIALDVDGERGVEEAQIGLELEQTDANEEADEAEADDDIEDAEFHAEAEHSDAVELEGDQEPQDSLAEDAEDCEVEGTFEETGNFSEDAEGSGSDEMDSDDIEASDLSEDEEDLEEMYGSGGDENEDEDYCEDDYED